MKEINNVEVITEENNEITVTEEKKEGKLAKVGNWVKKNGLKTAIKVVGVGAVGVACYLFGAHSNEKSEGGDYAEDFDVVDAEDYFVEDAE